MVTSTSSKSSLINEKRRYSLWLFSRRIAMIAFGCGLTNFASDNLSQVQASCVAVSVSRFSVLWRSVLREVLRTSPVRPIIIRRSRKYGLLSWSSCHYILYSNKILCLSLRFPLTIEKDCCLLDMIKVKTLLIWLQLSIN